MLKMVNGKWVELTEAEKQEIEESLADTPPTPDDRLTALEAENKELKDQTKMLTECILEMSEIIYAE